jgi:hypothetical protein
MTTSLARAAVPHSETCPWCEQPIPHDKFQEIHERITAKERVRTATIEATLKQEYAIKAEVIQAERDAKVNEVMAVATSSVKAADEKAQAEVEKARHEAKRAADEANKAKLAEVEAVKRASAEQIETLQKSQDDTLNARLHELRAILEEAQRKERDAEKARAFKERQKFTNRLELLQRQLEKKTADELGEGAEVDLYETLRDAFPTDDIKRVKKGEAGADIIHTVIEDGRSCGTLVYDSKNRGSWQNLCVTKLAKDKIAAKADHAILTSPAFPAGASQLHHQDGVIVANPARALAVVQMLRKHIVHVSTLQLSEQDRDEKQDALYQFMMSDRCRGLFEQIEVASEDLFELDVKEQRAHTSTWKRRGELIVSVQKSQGTLVAEVAKILTAPFIPGTTT